jgi:Uma2 family endonuclease
MTTVAAQTHLTPDDVLRLEEKGLFELVDGKLVEKHLGPLVSQTVGLIVGRLVSWRGMADAGAVVPEQTFQCFPHEPQMVRRPDVAFIAANRVADVPEGGHVPIAPDLAVEVISHQVTLVEFEKRLDDYRAAGIALVWVVFPKHRRVRVYRLDRTISEFSEAEALTGESVLPGFSVTVRDLLPARAAVERVR